MAMQRIKAMIRWLVIRLIIVLALAGLFFIIKGCVSWMA